MVIDRRQAPGRRRMARTGRRDRPSSKGSGATILWIDDDDDEVEMYATWLQLSGFRVVPAAASDAVRKALTCQPDVVVLDLLLGRDDGWDVCRRLGDAAPRLPVIVLTAAVRPDGANRRRARLTPNCAAFVGKPCTPAVLASVVERVRGGDRSIELGAGLVEGNDP